MTVRPKPGIWTRWPAWRRAIDFAILVSILSGTSAAAQGEADNRAGQADAITVTGTRAAPEPEVVATGSRIARPDQGTFFGTVATRTGVAGMTPGSGMDPFAGGRRIVTESSCRASDPRLSADAACRFQTIQHLIAAAAHAEARAAIDRFLADETVTDEERYLAAGLWYRLAEATGDPMDREDALLAMIATEAMPAPDRVSALRALAGLALRRAGDAEAAGFLERLLPLAADDAGSRVNLAGIYARTGREGDARRLMDEAIAIARANGEPVPAAWIAFMDQPPNG